MLAIAGRILGAGATPWRLSTADYAEAADSLAAESRLALTGAPVSTGWDEALAARMLPTGAAVHEESLLPVLLPDESR